MDKYNTKSIDDFIKEFDEEDKELERQKEGKTFTDLMMMLQDELQESYNNKPTPKVSIHTGETNTIKNSENKTSFITRISFKENIFIIIFKKFKNWLYT